MYMDDINLFAKKDKELETIIKVERIYSQDKGMEFGRGKICDAKNESWETTYDRKNRTNKSRKNQEAWRKRNLQIHGTIESGHRQTSGDERKKSYKCTSG